MKRRKKEKQILIKRVNFENDTFDYIPIEEKTGNEIVESTKNYHKGMKFEHAKWHISSQYKINRFFKNQTFKTFSWTIIVIFLTLLFQYFYDKWVKP